MNSETARCLADTAAPPDPPSEADLTGFMMLFWRAGSEFNVVWGFLVSLLNID